LLLNNAIEKLSKAYNDSLERDRFTEIVNIHIFLIFIILYSRLRNTENFFHQLGQAYILKTTIESDEEQIMKAYEKGLECLKKAYKLDPGIYS
jgi:hypothetical protein